MKLEEITLFSHLVARPESELDLLRAVLLVAEPEYPGLDVAAYVEEMDRLGASAKQRIAAAPGRSPLACVIRYLYEELGFHGNVQDYYDPRNSFLNEVIDRRTGIPDQPGADPHRDLPPRRHRSARRLVPGPFPGARRGRWRSGVHRSVRRAHARPPPAGRAAPARDRRGGPIDPRVLAPAAKRQVLARILNNLRNIYERSGDRDRLLGVLARMQVLRPDDEARGRWKELADPTRRSAMN